MSIRTRPYETLIRHNRTVVNGQDVDSIAAHHVRIKEYLDDEEVPPQVVSAKLLDPEPLDAAGLEAVLGQALVTATAQVTTLQARVAELEQQLAQQSSAAAPEAAEEVTAEGNPPAA